MNSSFFFHEHIVSINMKYLLLFSPIIDLSN